MSTLVSVVVPTFNRANLLPEAVDSVRQQTFESWELLVVDDGSSDGTEAVMKRFLDDPRINYLRQDNRGQAAARNAGINSARGDLVAFLDSDNRWLPHKLAAQVAFMGENPNTDVLYGETERIDNAGKTWPSPTRRRFSGVVWKELLVDNFVNFNTAIVRRHRLTEVGGMNEQVRCGDDYDLWLRLASRSTFHFLPGVVAQYRVEGPRISDDLEGRMRSNATAVDRFLRSNRGLLTPREIRQVRSRIYGRFSRAFANSGQALKGIALGLTATAYDPLSWRAWRTLGAVCAKPLRLVVSSRSEAADKSIHDSSDV